MQKNQLFTKCNEPLKVGSIVRHSGYASCFMEVTRIEGDTVVLKSHGRTHYGTFKPSVRPREIRTVLGTKDAHYYGLHFWANAYCTADSRMFGKGAGYDYYHVTRIKT